MPDELLNDKQQRVKRVTLSGKRFFDRKAAASALAPHKLPAYFMDFETRELLQRDTGLSIGIVAVSEAQQDEIESALEALANEDAEFAARLEREYQREDEDQFNGLFVKNLENVQGDERDVIILSICYAPGPDGKMLMNFGPINQRGGEKRLSVIFSRARHRMAVVSTIQAEAITNVHNDGAAALRAFLQFAQASARGEFERAQAVLGAVNAGAREAFIQPDGNDAIRQAIAGALRDRGHVVHERVGRSQFRCDLAVPEPRGDGYALAILLDAPDAAVADTRERYVFRPDILRKFGWKVVDVPGRDWLRDPHAVLGRIEAALRGQEDDAGDSFDFAALEEAASTRTDAVAWTTWLDCPAPCTAGIGGFRIVGSGFSYPARVATVPSKWPQVQARADADDGEILASRRSN